MGLSLLAEALATTDVSFVVGLISQLVDAGTRRRKVDERELNFMLSVVKGAKPKDQIEAMLAAQMAAVHTTFWRSGNRKGARAEPGSVLINPVL
jgi:hypothetical protein